MSPRRSVAPGSTGAGSGGGRIAVTVLLVLIVALALLLIVRARPEPGSFDPRSGRGDGTRALVLLLEGQGATVDVVRTAPRPGESTRVLVLDDSLDDDQRTQLLEFVEAGGVAVVADPDSALHGGADVDGGAQRVTGDVPSPTATSASSEANVPNGLCTIEALAELRGVFVRDGVLFPVGQDEPQCFGDRDLHAFAIRSDIGRGTVVGLGDNGLLTNELIRYADNSGLAVALLAPRAGSSVTVLLGDSVSKSADDVGSGDDTLSDLVRPGVWMGLAQLALAFLVLAVARGIRPGRPVDEPQPSPLAGSDAVHARATMMRRAGHHARAGWLLRSDLHRELCDRYHLPLDTSADELDRAAVDRDGMPRGAVASTLMAETPDSASLVALSNTIDRLRAESTCTDSVPLPTGGPAT
jgi:hypothetical protein